LAQLLARLTLKLGVVDRLVGIQRFYEIESFARRVLSREAQKINDRVRIDHDQLLLADVRFHGWKILSQSVTVRRGYYRDNVVDRKDVMLAVFAASSGVGGLVLVFLGILITTIGGYPGATSEAALRPFRRGAWAAVGVFGASLVTVAITLLWLAVTDARWLYGLSLTAFGLLLLALFGLAAAVTKAVV
jgi:hypothetical protein